MFGKNDYIKYIMDRLGYDSEMYDFSESDSVNKEAEYVEYVDPELSFIPFKNTIVVSPVFERKIINNTVYMIEMEDKLMLDGDKLFINFIAESFNDSKGTKLKISTKYTESYSGKDTMVFLSVNDKERYLNLNS